MPWTVAFHQAFEAEFGQLPLEVREALAATAGLLQLQGPLLGRPHADTLAGSDYANMKELRFDADDGVWRVAFAFDTARQAILLVAGDKAWVAQKRFYKALIAKADARFAEHLETLKG
ncbi:addiction module toxin RelE [Sandarakinorhabdus cyanobacteriorum]|uniref:Addiction module toxin RelE n=1 Tax=Sandarakinorhabdus cyanobacteriorum TaxID=1981098 RepID=A0A255Z6Q5_9SPHN|nr:type II toxin-antitoxin system RelE/ParE family toxin [Sandarakinorhabdus cyanobacteriorum]OYQ37119.1 addiction module toxin RelE [Sandarakinorhabdus cyanobacteriorum]